MQTQNSKYKMEKQNPNKYIAVMYKLYALDGEGGSFGLLFGKK